MDTTHTKATTIAATAARMIRCQRLMPNTDSPFVGLRHAAYSRDSSTVIFIRLRSALSIPSASSLPATCASCCCSAARSCSLASFGSPGVTLVTANTSRSEEHTSELQSLMRISYAVFCLKKKKNKYKDAKIYGNRHITTKCNKEDKQR